MSSIELPDFKLALAPYAPESKYKRKQAEETTSLEEPTFDDDAALFWSSAGIPDAPEAH